MAERNNRSAKVATVSSPKNKMTSANSLLSDLRKNANSNLSNKNNVPNRKVLELLQKVPNTNEVKIVGEIQSEIKTGDKRLERLVENRNPKIIFKDEEGNSSDRLMTADLKAKLDKLAELVIEEWPLLKLRVTEAWDEDDEHSKGSTHYEGRAVDLTTSDKDKLKLGRLGQLATEAGFDWVYYEDIFHIHASVKN